jgi:hypothetical protein
LEESKSLILHYLSKMMTTIKLDDFSIEMLGTQQLSNIYFQGVQIEDQDVDISIHGERVKVMVHRMGGRITGHSWKKVLFGEETFDFDVNC